MARLLVAYALLLCTGLLGGHLRYLGRNWAALGYLLTGGVFGVGALVDLWGTYYYVEEANMSPRHVQRLLRWRGGKARPPFGMVRGVSSFCVSVAPVALVQLLLKIGLASAGPRLRTLLLANGDLLELLQGVLTSLAVAYTVCFVSSLGVTRRSCPLVPVAAYCVGVRLAAHALAVNGVSTLPAELSGLLVWITAFYVVRRTTVWTPLPIPNEQTGETPWAKAAEARAHAAEQSQPQMGTGRTCSDDQALRRRQKHAAITTGAQAAASTPGTAGSSAMYTRPARRQQLPGVQTSSSSRLAALLYGLALVGYALAVVGGVAYAELMIFRMEEAVGIPSAARAYQEVLERGPRPDVHVLRHKTGRTMRHRKEGEDALLGLMRFHDAMMHKLPFGLWLQRHFVARGWLSGHLVQSAEAMHVLGINDFPPTRETIMKAHRTLSLRWHPDKNRGREPLAQKMQVQLNAAKQALLELVVEEMDGL